MARDTNLHRNNPVIHHDLLRQKVGADGRLVLIVELLVDVLVHDGRLSDAGVAEDDDLEKDFARHDGLKPFSDCQDRSTAMLEAEKASWARPIAGRGSDLRCVVGETSVWLSARCLHARVPGRSPAVAHLALARLHKPTFG